MVKRIAVLVVIAILRCNNGVAAERELTQADISKIKRVCRSLVGVPAWRPYEIFRSRLASYVRSKQDLEESRIVTCSGACGGALILRGGAEIYYGYPNPVGEPHYVDTVVLHIRGKRVLSIGPGRDYYPYPYYEEEHKKP